MATKKMPASKNEIKNKYKMESISTPFINPIVHEGSGAALTHGGGLNFPPPPPPPLAKIQTTKAVDLKLGTVIK